MKKDFYIVFDKGLNYQIVYYPESKRKKNSYENYIAEIIYEANSKIYSFPCRLSILREGDRIADFKIHTKKIEIEFQEDYFGVKLLVKKEG